MLRLLVSIVGAEIRLTVRRAGTTALLFVVAGLLLAVSLLFFMAATFILLAERYDTFTASLVLAGFTLLIGLIFLFVALMRTRRRSRPAPYYGGYGAYGAPPPPPAAPPGPAPGSIPGAPPGAPAPGNVTTTLAIAAGAALIGLILGRRV